MLNGTKMPAVLVEVGYIGGDAKLLQSTTYLNNVAWSIAYGIINYVGQGNLKYY